MSYKQKYVVRCFMEFNVSSLKIVESITYNICDDPLIVHLHPHPAKHIAIVRLDNMTALLSEVMCLMGVNSNSCTSCC